MFTSPIVQLQEPTLLTFAYYQDLDDDNYSDVLLYMQISESLYPDRYFISDVSFRTSRLGEWFQESICLPAGSYKIHFVALQRNSGRNLAIGNIVLHDNRTCKARLIPSRHTGKYIIGCGLFPYGRAKKSMLSHGISLGI